MNRNGDGSLKKEEDHVDDANASHLASESKESNALKDIEIRHAVPEGCNLNLCGKRPRKKYKGVRYKERPKCPTCHTVMQLQWDGLVPHYCSGCGAPLQLNIRDFTLTKFESWRESILSLDEYACLVHQDSSPANHKKTFEPPTSVYSEVSNNDTTDISLLQSLSVNHMTKFQDVTRKLPTNTSCTDTTDNVNTKFMTMNTVNSRAPLTPMSIPQSYRGSLQSDHHDVQLQKRMSDADIEYGIHMMIEGGSNQSAEVVCDACPVCSYVHTTPSHLDCPKFCVKCKSRLLARGTDQRLSADGTQHYLHTCDTCEAAFGSKDKLSRHKLTVHSDARPYKCGLCSKTFKLSYQLNRHMRVAHPSVKNWYHCEQCDYECDQKSKLNEHVRATHKQVNGLWMVQCSKCFSTHKVPSNQEPPAVCDVCEEGLLTDNAGRLPNDIVSRQQPQTAQKLNLKVEETAIPLQADAAAQVAATLNGDNGDSVADAPVAIQKVYYPEHWPVAVNTNIDSVTKDHFMVSETAQLSPPTSAGTHQLMHVCDKPGCTARFKKSSILQRHLNTVHSEERPYKCEFCSKSFKRNDRLLVHVRSVHMRNGPKCGSCGDEFADTNALLAHMRNSHKTTERSEDQSIQVERKSTNPEGYICKHCNKHFHLYRRLRTHRCRGQRHLSDDTDIR